MATPDSLEFAAHSLNGELQHETARYDRRDGRSIPGDPIRQMDVYERWVDWLIPYLK
jgi:hypothetical protein